MSDGKGVHGPQIRKGTAEWWHAVQEAIGAAAKRADYESAAALALELDQDPVPGALPAALICCSKALVQMLNANRRDVAEHILARVDELTARGEDAGGIARGYVARASGDFRAGIGDLGGWLHHLGISTAEFRMTGDVKNAIESLVHQGYAYLRLGSPVHAEQLLRSAVEQAESNSLHDLVALAQHNLGLALSQLGQHEEAILVEQEALDAYVDENPRMEGGCREYLARILLAAGRLDLAEEEARLAVGLSSPAARVAATGVLASILLAQGRGEEAEQMACDAVAMAAPVDGVIEEGDGLARLAYARALLAVGNREEAEEAVKIARKKLLAQAARIQDERWRASFLENIEEHRDTLRLYEALLQNG